MSLNIEGLLASKEIGESGRANLKRFAGAVPQLDDIKKTVEYYQNKIG